MKNVAIVSTFRSPLGKSKKGAFNSLRSDDLTAQVVKYLIKKVNIDKKRVEDICIGCAMPEAEQGMNIARGISFLSDLPNSVSAMTVNRFCASGLQAIANIALSIETNSIKIGIGGGTESMSLIPMGGYNLRANNVIMKNYPDYYLGMGLTAENIAERYSVSREDQDIYSLNSHKKAIKAIESGIFKEEIVPIKVTSKITQEVDEGPRSDTTINALNRLRPVFKKEGSVTAGNSSQLTDGAAVSLLMNAEDAKKEGVDILGYFRDYVTVGVDPEIMGIGPVPAVRKILERNNLSIEDIDLFEINEAFAAQVIYCIRELGIDESKVNINGGAISLGHPLGCTGARLVTTLLNTMKRKEYRYGICTMCVGGGMGAAALIEVI